MSESPLLGAYDDLPADLRPILSLRKPGAAVRFRCRRCGRGWLGKHPSVCPECLPEEHAALVNPRSLEAAARLLRDRVVAFALEPPEEARQLDPVHCVDVDAAVAWLIREAPVGAAAVVRGDEGEELYVFVAWPTHACERCRATAWVAYDVEEFSCGVCKVGKAFRLPRPA